MVSARPCGIPHQCTARHSLTKAVFSLPLSLCGSLRIALSQSVAVFACLSICLSLSLGALQQLADLREHVVDAGGLGETVTSGIVGLLRGLEDLDHTVIEVPASHRKGKTHARARTRAHT